MSFVLMEDADLRRVTLTGARIKSAVLCNADLWCADLRDASLVNVNLSGANLRGADLRGAVIYSTDGAFQKHKLKGADFRDAKFSRPVYESELAQTLREAGAIIFDEDVPDD
jgi:uncharacterized protein YjbI with pentapeptide repeats